MSKTLHNLESEQQKRAQMLKALDEMKQQKKEFLKQLEDDIITDPDQITGSLQAARVEMQSAEAEFQQKYTVNK